MNNCLFCKIAKEEIKSKMIYQDDYVFVFLDINPTANGHTLIIPKKHIKDIDDIDEETYLHIFKISKEIKNLLIEKLNCDGIKIVQNNGDCQEVKHYHIHLIPYYKSKQKLSLEEVYQKIMQ